MSDHINTSKIQSVEINSQSYYIDGEDIGKGILPKLVHRVSLHPVYDEDTNTIVENQYFTLHNDAGDLMYASKFLQGDSSFQSVVTGNTGGGGGGEEPPIPPPVPPKPYPPFPWPIPDGVPVPVPDDDEDEDQWVVLPVVIPSGPYGPGPSRPRRGVSGRPKTRRVNPKPKPPTKGNKGDGVIRYIDGMYTNLALKKIPAKDQREWDNMRVYSAQKTFEGTEITYINHPWTVLKRGYKMFYSCPKLRRINTRTRFPKLVDGEQMFENCKDLLGFFMDEGFSAYNDYFDFSRLKSAIRMFANCKVLTHVKLYLPNVINTSAMFLNNENIGVVDIEYQGNSPKCTTAVSMYEGCKYLKTLKPKSVFANSLRKADYMFWQSGITQMPVASMPGVDSAKGMYYGCKGFTKLDCKFPSLKDATSMFQNSGVKEFDYSNYPKIEIGKQMFALCDLSETTVDIKFEKLQDGLNMFRNCNIVNIGEFEVPMLNKAGGFLGGCKLNAESALKVINYVKGRPVADLSKGSDYYMQIGIQSSLMTNADFRAKASLPAEVPSTAGQFGEFAYFDEAKTQGVAIFWN